MLLVIPTFEAFAGNFTNESTRNSWYNRTNARQYALNWAWSANPNYVDYTNYGGDCTNFVSQVLRAGGMGDIGYPTPGNYSSWYYRGGNVPDRSYSWTSAHWFRYHWANVNGSGYNRAYQYKVYTVNSALSNWRTVWEDLWPGDIVQHINYSNGQTYHSQVITDYSSSPTLTLNYAQHTSNYSGGDIWEYLKHLQNIGYGTDYFVTTQIKLGS